MTKGGDKINLAVLAGDGFRPEITRRDGPGAPKGPPSGRDERRTSSVPAIRPTESAPAARGSNWAGECPKRVSMAAETHTGCLTQSHTHGPTVR
jgi:hypothetical protein